MKILLILCLLAGFFPQTAAAESLPVVILDAGHGGEDGGCAAGDGTLESDLNLEITRRLEIFLPFLGQPVKMIRTGKGSMASPEAETLREKKRSDLQRRKEIINAVDAGRLISVHQNSLPGHPEVHGAQVFYNTVPGAEAMAGSVQAALNKTVNAKNGKHHRPIGADIYLMQQARCPAILVECGFLSHRGEAAQLKKEDYQKQLAAVLAAGYFNYRDGGRE